MTAPISESEISPLATRKESPCSAARTTRKTKLTKARQRSLNKVRIICDSLMNDNGILRADKQIKLTPERSVVKLHVGDPISLTEADFERLSAAFFAELERRFL